MQDLLLNPAVQGGVVPALVALVVVALSLRSRALALVPVAGFLAVVLLAVGFSFEPMTARSKVVAAVLGAGVLALLLDIAKVRATAVLRGAIALLAAAAALWVASRVLQQQQGAALWGHGAAVVGFALLMLGSSGMSGGDSLRTLVVGTVLGLAAGALGMLGASVSAALMGIALGASCGVAVLAQMLRGRSTARLDFLDLPVASYVVLGGVMSSLTGELPGYALAPMLLVPLAARLVPRRDAAPAWRDALLSGLAALLPALLAVALAVWSSRGGAPA
jgi:hypothetical protein